MSVICVFSYFLRSFWLDLSICWSSQRNSCCVSIVSLLCLYCIFFILLTSTLIFIIPFLLLLTLGLICCWMMSWRGSDCWLTSKLDWAIGDSSSPPCPWNIYSVPYVLKAGAIQGLSLKLVMCLWDHLDGTSDQTQLSPLCKLLRFLQADAESYSSCDPPR